MRRRRKDRAPARSLPRLRLLERATNEHLHELLPVPGARERVGRRARALGGTLRRRGGVGAAGELLLDTRRSDRAVGHVREGDRRPAPVLRERGDADERPVLRPAVELQVAPAATGGLRDTDLGQDLVGRQVGFEQALEEVARGDVANATRPRTTISAPSATRTVGMSRPGRRAPPSRRSSRRADLRVADLARRVRRSGTAPAGPRCSPRRGAASAPRSRPRRRPP